MSSSASLAARLSPPPSFSSSSFASTRAGCGDVGGAGVSPAEQVPFASDRYARLILAQMNRMRLRADFCDVRLRVGERAFQVHRLVLAASSPYFCALFSGGMKEADKEEVHILGVEAGIFEVLLDFIYTGGINVSVENVQELMVAADMLQLAEVVSICGEFLKGHMDPSNCAEEFWGLSAEQLVRLLRSEELRIEEEYQVFTAAMAWLHQDVGRRRKHVVEVLGPVRFPLLSPQRLLKYIDGIADFSLRVALQTLLKEYMEVTKSPKENKMYGLVETRPRRKARKYLYAIGGYTRLQGGRWSDSRALSCVERFDSFNQYWTTVSSLHQARSGLGVAVLDGMIYVVGGEGGEGRGGGGGEGGRVEAEVRGGRWRWSGQAVASLTFPRCGVGVCPCHGALYAFGGWIGSEIGKTVERYDPEENKWEVIGSMPFHATTLAAVSYKEKWVEVASMSTARAGVSVSAVNGLLYAVGGRATSRDFSAPVTVDSVEIYDPHLDTWTAVGNMIASRCDGGLAVL
ncbi:hypothetical protein CRUP_006576 [Coryphaenoides rupestris]|nr:hypothetical protein CRUP_006576 [Coryphaenoides rupestris]